MHLWFRDQSETWAAFIQLVVSPLWLSLEFPSHQDESCRLKSLLEWAPLSDWRLPCSSSSRGAHTVPAQGWGGHSPPCTRGREELFPDPGPWRESSGEGLGGGSQDGTRPGEGTRGTPRDGDTVSPLRQEGQERGPMAVPQNSKTVRDGLGLQRAAKWCGSTRDPADKVRRRPGLGGVATAWVQGWGCHSSKELMTGLDVLSLRSHRNVHPSEDTHSANSREWGSVAKSSRWVQGDTDLGMTGPQGQEEPATAPAQSEQEGTQRPVPLFSGQGHYTSLQLPCW